MRGVSHCSGNRLDDYRVPGIELDVALRFQTCDEVVQFHRVGGRIAFQEGMQKGRTNDAKAVQLLNVADLMVPGPQHPLGAMHFDPLVEAAGRATGQGLGNDNPTRSS